MYKTDNRGKIRLTFQALADLLNLPDDAEIFGIQMEARDLEKSQFNIFVRHPALPVWQEGEEPPVVSMMDFQIE